MRPSVRLRLTRRLALSGVVALASAGLAGVAVGPASAATSATVSINAAQARAPFSGAGVGMNVAVWDGRMNGPDTTRLLRDAGITAVRFPGGGYGDGYHWQTHTVEGGGFVAPNTDFDGYVATVRAAGGQPVVIANYGSGTPQEAAEWVRYANITRGYGVRYWEIGNEVYGNGHYGAQWETDHHASKSPTTYATNLLQYASAMKAVDPTVKIGAVLTTPNNWPDGIVGPGDTMDWNNTVLSIAGPRIDFVIVHHYPFSTSEAEVLTKPQTEIPAMTSRLRALINQHAGANAANVGIAVTEASSQFALNTSPSGLYAPDMYLTWMEHGAFNVDWWNLRNGTDCSRVTVIQGATDYNDGGVVSSGASCEPPANTPFAPYHGIQMITKLGAGGDTLVQASTSNPLLSAHAVRRANGDLNVMLINKDPNNDTTVSLSYNGFTPSSGTPTVYSYLKNASSIGSAASGSATTQTVPAYSIVVVQLRPGSGGGTGTCRVTYAKANEWPGGLVANVTIANTGSGSINNWELAFRFPGDTRVGNAWDATVIQNGAVVTATNAAHNATIPPGGSRSFGFTGSWTTNNTNPTTFTLNGTTCTTS